MLSFKQYIQLQEQKGGQGVMPAGTGLVRGIKRFAKTWKKNWRDVKAEGPNASWMPKKKNTSSSSSTSPKRHSGGAYPHRPDTGYHKKKPSAYAILRHNDEKEHQNAIRTKGEKKTTKQRKHTKYLKTRMKDYAEDDRKFKDKLNNGKASRRDADGIKLKTGLK